MSGRVHGSLAILALTASTRLYMGIFFKVSHIGKFQNEFGRMSFRKTLQMDQYLSFLEG